MDDVPPQAQPAPTVAEVPCPSLAAEGLWSKRFRRLRRGLVFLAIGIALTHPVASIVARRFWIADLVTHFQEPALVASCLAAIVCLASGFRRTALFLLLLTGYQVVPLVRYSGANPVLPDPGSKERLHILLSNVLYENEIPEDLEHLIRTEKPDVVGLVEYAPRIASGLSNLRAGYPYHVDYPAGASGLALWFREEPIGIGKPEWFVSNGNPVIHARFRFAGKERHLWLVHPRSPLSWRRVGKAGNPEMDAIAMRVKETGGSTIVMGDMNSTDGSAHFRDLLETTGLRDSRYGFGRQGSWPTDQPYRIAIDHVFLSDDLAVTERRLGHMVGSDHFPVVIELAPAASSAKK